MTPDVSFYKPLDYINEFIPPILYLDTSFVVEALVEGQQYHERSRQFISDLAKDSDNQPILIFSDLLIIELKCAVISICIRNEYGRSAKLHKKIKEKPDLVSKYYSNVIEVEKQWADTLCNFKNWASISITKNIIERAGEIMPLYRLGSMDAIHIATMEAWDIKDVASLDWGFGDLPRYKPNCRVWSCDGWKKYTIRKEARKRIAVKSKEAVEEAEQIIAECNKKNIKHISEDLEKDT